MRNTSFVIATALASSLVASADAWAGGGKHHGDRHGHGHQHHGHHHKHKGQYPRHPRGYSGHHRKYDSDDDEELLIGLLVGGLFGYVIGNQQPSYDYGGNGYPSYDIQPQSNSYADRQYNYPSSDSTCLQRREYQSKVIVGGKPVDAYGTACLQPDGSWHRGPAQLVSY
jgi:hypothetical protein